MLACSAIQAHDHTDTQLEPANAQATASALLRKSQISAPLHAFTCQPQVAQEIGDVVTFTDALVNTTYTARVRSFSIHFDRDKGTWLQRFSLGAV